MEVNFMTPLINTLRWSPDHVPLVAIAASMTIIVAISILSLMAGWFIIFQNLYYFPIIIACVYYAKRGFIFSVLVAGLYFALILAFTQDPAIIQGAIIRVAIFILIAGVVTYLSLKQIHVEEELKDSQRRLADIIEFLPDATFAIDTDGTVIAWNRAMEEMTGVRATEMLGKGDYEYAIPFYRERRRILVDLVISYDEETASWYPEITRDGDRLISQVLIQHLNNGKGAYLWVVASPLYNSAGKVSGAIESIRDITTQKKLERDLNTALERTEQSNADLEQFAYVASHDLQEPLRMVSSYVQLLARKYEGKLDSDADDYISFAVDGARRMQVLINDLLEYSRVTTRGESFKSVNCEMIIERVLHNLKMAIEENDAVITHDPLPTVIVDGSQIGQVFQNLIGNAIKYRSKEPPLIHISARKDGNKWLFSVRDNGIGIDSKYKERIFIIFQRLHGRNEYPGTGLGLAISRRIIERHKGRIWMESEVGKGTTFYFTLPVNGEE